MNIQEFSRRKLLNNQYLAFGREIETAVQQANPATLNVASVFDEYKAALKQFDDSIVTVSKSSLTDEMVIADGERDNFYVGIIEQIQTSTRHFAAEKKAAAERMLPLVNTFKGGQRRSYDDETGFVYNFLQELTSDKYKTDATLLSLDEWIAQLKTANDRCAALTSARTDEKSAINATGKTVNTRPLLDKAYDALRERLNALALINGDAAYIPLFTYWNTRIDHYRVMISSRLGAGAGGKTGSGGTPDKPKENERPDEV